jgi:hypothetical protein
MPGATAKSKLEAQMPSLVSRVLPGNALSARLGLDSSGADPGSAGLPPARQRAGGQHSHPPFSRSHAPALSITNISDELSLRRDGLDRNGLRRSDA